MNIIKHKSGSTKFVSAIVIGSLFNGAWANASSGDRKEIVKLISSPCYRSELTPNLVQRLSTKDFAAINYGNAYDAIFGDPELRAVVSKGQVAVVPPRFGGEMNLFELNDEQLEGVTPDQILKAGKKTLLTPLTTRLKNPEQQKALKVSINRFERTQQLFHMIEEGGNQEEMIKLVKEGINFNQRNENYRCPFFAACCWGRFDLAVGLLGPESDSCISEINRRIMFLCLTNLKNGNLSKSDREKVEILIRNISCPIFPKWLEQVKSLQESPDKLRDCYRTIMAWLLGGSDYHEYPPALEEYFVAYW
jgi:hypothetical protein